MGRARVFNGPRDDRLRRIRRQGVIGMSNGPRAHCIQLPNLPGTLEPVVADLARANVNIESLIAHKGRLIMAVDRPDVLRQILRQRGIPFQEEPCEPAGTGGTLLEVAGRLGALSDELASLKVRLGEEDPLGVELPTEIRETLMRIAADLGTLASF